VNFRSPLRSGGSGVLSITPFRRLWVALSLSSLGDWLSLVALSALADKLGGTGSAYAVSGVWLTSLLPALLFGPLAGAVADKFDRRHNMIIGDVARAALYVTIPLNLTFGFANQLTWLYVVQFLASCASLFWAPAKDASVPNLVPPDKLEQANQFSLFSTYATAPVAALLFAVLTLISEPLSANASYDLALYINAATFIVSALTVFMLRELRRRRGDAISSPSVLKSIWEGWRFVGQTQVVRGILLGLTGAFAAGGVVVGLGPAYVRNTLEGCSPHSPADCGGAGWGAVFAALFVGLAIGMFLGLRVLRGFSRRRLFGVSIMFAALPLGMIALIPSLVLTVILTVVLGACAGVAYVTGYTVIGLEVDDETRGRTFSFLQSAIRVILFAAIAIAPTLAGGFNSLADAAGGSSLHIGGFDYRNVGYTVVLLLAAAVAVALGRMAYQQMDDRNGVPLLADLGSLFRPDREESVNSHRKERRWARFRQAGRGESGAQTPGPEAVRRPGVFLALEGGEGTGKSTQARLLAIWLREQGYDVVTTHEPGATKIGLRLRALLLDTAHVGLAPRAEALMYAADRAEHVQDVILPALERGAVVVTDRYVDSSLAYQGAGRQLPVSEIAGLNRWATGGLTPDLTILLDLPTVTGLSRRLSSADRLESEPVEFHERVRSGFLSLAATEPGRYLVVDADRPESEISREIQLRVRELLPDPIPFSAEENTGSFPAVRE